MARFQSKVIYHTKDQEDFKQNEKKNTTDRYQHQDEEILELPDKSQSSHHENASTHN
jgi:hypothetical protein